MIASAFHVHTTKGLRRVVEDSSPDSENRIPKADTTDLHMSNRVRPTYRQRRHQALDQIDPQNEARVRLLEEIL